MARRKNRGGQLLFEFAFIPNKVRRACDVPQSECENCALSTEDHTVGFAVENKNYHLLHPESRAYIQRYCLVGLDYETL